MSTIWRIVSEWSPSVPELLLGRDFIILTTSFSTTALMEKEQLLFSFKYEVGVVSVVDLFFGKAWGYIYQNNH